MLPDRKNVTVKLADLPTASPSAVPAWMQQMREAARAQISQADVEEIVKGQVERAKKGDTSAIKFVFDQVLGGAAFKGATIIQHNTENHTTNQYGVVAEGEVLRPEKPMSPRVKAAAAVEVMRARLDAGLPLTKEGDGGKVDLT